MADYMVYSNFGGKKVVGFHESSAGHGSGLGDSNVSEIIIPPYFGGREVVEIGYNAFRNTGITSIFIPKTVEYLNYHCFHSCLLLKTIHFEENSRLRKLDYGVFAYCRSLEFIDLPPSISEVLSDDGKRLFLQNYAMTCLSYLGIFPFTGPYIIQQHNDSIVVHTLQTYDEDFGTITPIKDGNRCNSSPIVISMYIPLKCNNTHRAGYTDLYITLLGLVLSLS